MTQAEFDSTQRAPRGEAAVDTVDVVIAYEDPDDVRAITDQIEVEVPSRILQATATAPSTVAGKVPLPTLVDGLTEWMRRTADGVTLLCERAPEEGVLSVRAEPSPGAHQLIIGAPGWPSRVYDLERSSRSEMADAIRALAGLTALDRAAELSTDKASRFLWPPYERRMGFQGLAQYVSPPALRGLGLNVGVPDEPRGDDSVTSSHERSARLFDNLRRREIEYARDPWMGLDDQQVRHPWWLVEDKWGTCLDLVVTYAAMCIQARIRPLVCITSDHALVVIDPALGVPDEGLDPWKPTWSVRARDARGVVTVQAGDARTALESALQAETLLVVDVVAATRGADFDVALRQGREWLARGLSTLVDVAYLHTQRGSRPLPDPEERRRTLIRTYPQSAPEPVTLYGSQEAVFDELRGEEGIVVLLAPQGQGKSTVARQLQLGAPFGEGWFLNASEPQRLIASLADADQAERNRTAGGLAAMDRRGFYESALGRLGAAPGRWIAVFDNADGDPGKIVPLLPQPGPGQLVVITSTNGDWASVPGVRVRRLPPVEDVEATAKIGEELTGLASGRALLVEAFSALKSAAGISAADIALHAPAADAISVPRRGPAAFWAALRSALDLDARTLGHCLQCAYLPPDHGPLKALEALDPDALEVVTKVGGAGLLTFDAEARLVRMHRLIGDAVRTDLGATEPELSEHVVLELTTPPEVFDAFDRYADQETLTRLDERLAEVDARRTEPDARLGEALHRVAALLELGGHTRRSGETYARAERHVQDRPELLADVLHSRARTVNQHHVRDETRLREALEWAVEAERLMRETPGAETGADRCLAMQGLLLQKLAAFPREGETTVQLLHDALAVIEEAHHRREIRLDELNPELARSEFNLAGPRINLAQREPERARSHLDAAERVYVDVRERRIRIYGRDVHPHIAACIIGEAYVNYYRALLVPAPTATRTAWLRAATERANEALRQREALDGSLDLDESRKVVRFLSKVALARTAPPLGATRAVESVATEVLRELAFAAAETLPSHPRDLTGPIAAWLFSPALAAVVQAFGETPPSANSPLADALTWFEEFSLRWDYRGGKERNLVAPQDLGPDVEEVVLRSAAALGLVGTTLPSAEHYDHVLVLGGLVRACMARPLYAARLVNEGTIKTDVITALGGFRELKGDELELAAKLGHADLTDEFDAMDAGVRSAFALGEPLLERGEHSDTLGESWMIREYSTADGVPVRVVAAPSSEPGVRRANTADTYEWFASQLAHLRGGDRVLVVTSDIYVPYQHADALRMLGLPPYSAEVDAVGLRPGDAHPALTQEFKPHNYLQEMRSTIRALRALYEAWTKKTG